MARIRLPPQALCQQIVLSREAQMVSVPRSHIARSFQTSTPARPIMQSTRRIASICTGTLTSSHRAIKSDKACAGTSASFSTSSPVSDSATPATTSQDPAATSAQLSWNDFLKLRKRRRYVNLAASAGTAMGSVSIAAPLAIQYEIEDKIAAMTGLDPFIAFGLTITAVGGFGWLMGPFVGNAGFLMYNRSIKDEIALKERAFYDHIKRFRADPASSSVNNPVPDYYGEKISSVADYRRWLKDQRAFNRKKNKNLL